MTKRPTGSEIQADETYRGYAYDGQDLRHSGMEDYVFDDCSFIEADLTSSRLNGAVFRTCDLSGARMSGCKLFSASVDGCKLLGWDLRDGLNLTATAFTGCTLDFSLFRGVSLRKMMLERCALVEADLSLADLRETTFRDCDLSNVDLNEAIFHLTDLRGSTLTGWNLRRHDLAGIVIDTWQLRALATEIGILVLD